MVHQSAVASMPDPAPSPVKAVRPNCIAYPVWYLSDKAGRHTMQMDLRACVNSRLSSLQSPRLAQSGTFALVRRHSLNSLHLLVDALLCCIDESPSVLDQQLWEFGKASQTII